MTRDLSRLMRAFETGEAIRGNSGAAHRAGWNFPLNGPFDDISVWRISTLAQISLERELPKQSSRRKSAVR